MIAAAGHGITNLVIVNVEINSNLSSRDEIDEFKMQLSISIKRGLKKLFLLQKLTFMPFFFIYPLNIRYTRARPK